MTPEPTAPLPPDPAPAGESGPGAPADPRPWWARTLAYRRFWLLTLVVIAADQVTKAAIAARLPFGSYGPAGITIFPDFFYLVHVGNTGGAWSVFAGRSVALAMVGIVVLAAVFYWRRQLGLAAPFAQWCFGLFVGGSVGNIIDRLRHGHVIDFLDFHFGDYIYPTFNVADSAICVGVITYVIWSLRQPAPPAAG